jgi:hypothetical protein
MKATSKIMLLLLRGCSIDSASLDPHWITFDKIVSVKNGVTKRAAEAKQADTPHFRQ